MLRVHRNGIYHRRLALLFGAALGSSLSVFASAQERGKATAAVVIPEGGQTPREAGSQSIQDSDAAKRESPNDKDAKEKQKEEDKKKHPSRGSLVVAPLPISSPAIGTGIIPVLGYIFPFRKNDKVSPPSTIGVAGVITNNSSRAFGLGGHVFLKENTYEFTAAYGQADVNYSLYGTGFFFGSAGAMLKVPLNQSGHAFFGEALRRLAWKVFVGPRFFDGNSVVTLRPTAQIPALPPDLGIHTTLRALGVHMVRDTRPNQFYPTAGTKLEFTADFFAQALGSKYSFQSYKFYFDKYYSLTTNQVLVYDLFVCNTAGQPPFYGNCIYGTQNELRGYTAGQYLDRHMWATQLEYRLTLPKGFGLAGFGGIGEVIPGASQRLRTNYFLPSVGGGPRYQLNKKYHLNLRADFARGSGSWTWSVGVGEAF
jgi:hypothetical protein